MTVSKVSAQLSEQQHEIPLLPGESWWGGAVVEGHHMPYMPPFHAHVHDLGGNQGMPLLLSNRGRSIWAETPFAFTVEDRHVRVAGPNKIAVRQKNDSGTLRSAFLDAAQTYFPPSGTMPDPFLFSAPQYNLWIELLYRPTQAKVLAYAEAVLEHGFSPGVLMIDTLWSENYGTWQFHSGRFPDPKAMVAQLHDMGFKVMLWVCPFITADTLAFRQLRAQGYLVTTASNEPHIVEWWDGYSGCLDLTNPKATAWLHERLDHLVRFGIDGFKFDGGDPPSFSMKECEAWNRIGLSYPASEFRAAWRSAGLPLMQRIRDRAHSWDEEYGLGSLIPIGLAQGLLGYAFTCPDMIGGGDYASFPPSAENAEFLKGLFEDVPVLDAELFVRSAQCAALFPMMQFSAAPWRLLDDEHLGYCREAAALHTQFAPEILALAKHAAHTGEPIIRHMAYVYPNEGYERIRDQFLLGNDVLVAPVLEQGARHRKIVFPPGVWSGNDGSIVSGPTSTEVEAPLSRLPWYRLR